MKPATDAQTHFPAIVFTNDNLFYGMEAFSGLDLEENKLIPAGGYTLRRDWVGFRLTVLIDRNGVQL